MSDGSTLYIQVVILNVATTCYAADFMYMLVDFYYNRSVGMDQMAIPKETGTIIIPATCLSHMTMSGKTAKEGTNIFRRILLTK